MNEESTKTNADENDHHQLIGLRQTEEILLTTLREVTKMNVEHETQGKYLGEQLRKAVSKYEEMLNEMGQLKVSVTKMREYHETLLEKILKDNKNAFVLIQGRQKESLEKLEEMATQIHVEAGDRHGVLIETMATQLKQIEQNRKEMDSGLTSIKKNATSAQKSIEEHISELIDARHHDIVAIVDHAWKIGNRWLVSIFIALLVIGGTIIYHQIKGEPWFLSLWTK